MARELALNGHRYWIVSDPHGEGWRARVLELHEDGTDDIGIEATEGTRGAADAAAERKLRRLLLIADDKNSRSTVCLAKLLGRSRLRIARVATRG